MRKLKIEIDGNDSLLIEHKEETDIFHKSIDQLISSITNCIISEGDCFQGDNIDIDE